MDRNDQERKEQKCETLVRRVERLDLSDADRVKLTGWLRWGNDSQLTEAYEEIRRRESEISRVRAPRPSDDYELVGDGAFVVLYEDLKRAQYDPNFWRLAWRDQDLLTGYVSSGLTVAGERRYREALNRLAKLGAYSATPEASVEDRELTYMMRGAGLVRKPGRRVHRKNRR